MAVFTLTTFRSNLDTILSNTASQYSTTEQDRAVLQAISALSRFFPREVVTQTVYNEDVTSEAWTAISDTAVTLANKPIRFGSETVTQSSVDFTRNTDYEIDYVNGTVTMLSTGGLSAAAATITYKMDGTMVDTSSLFTALIAIDRVDIIRSDQVPQIFEGWIMHGDFLMVTDYSGGSQQRFVDNDHIRVYYYAQHTDPTTSVASSYPAFLDELVLIGAAGYAVMIKVFQRENQAVVDIAASRTAIDSIAALHTSIGTLFTNMALLTDINVALDAAAAEFVLAASRLVLADAEVVLANAEIDKYDITTTGFMDLAAAGITAANTAIDDIDTILDKVTTFADAATGSAEEALNTVNAELVKMDTQSTSALAEIGTATRNAELYLDTGDEFLNTITNAPDAAGDYRRYAEAKLQLAQIYNQVGSSRAAFASARVAEAGQRINQAGVFINEASARLAHCNAELSIVSANLSVADRHFAGAAGYLSVASGFISSAATRVNNGMGYVREAEVRVAEVGAHLNQINTYIGEITTYLGEADREQRNANAELAVAAALRREALEYLNSYFRSLRDRAQINTHPRASSVNQYASDEGNSRRFLSWDSYTTY